MDILQVIWFWVERSKVKFRVRVNTNVWSITPKTNDLKVFKLGVGNDLGISYK